MKKFAWSFFAAIALVGCGGGGGGGSSSPPTAQPQPQRCLDQSANNYNQPGPCQYGPLPNSDVMVFRTGRQQVHDRGFRGQGILIALLDDPLTRGWCNEGETPTDCLVRIRREIGWEIPVANIVELYYRDIDARSDHGIAMLSAIIGTFVNDPYTPRMSPIAPEAQILWRPLGYQELPYVLGRGARIINASWGVDVRSLDDYDAAQIESIRSKFEMIRQADAVLIQAQSYTRPSGPNNEIVPYQEVQGLALTRPDFEMYRGYYILVTAVRIDNAGQVVGLHQGATQSATGCGPQMWWCVSMPGAFGSIVFGGTSVAAAQASGYAAVLWSAFPWFSAPNLTVTLLTTARDIGAPGVDEVYGWGLIDIANAINGPRQFIYRDFVANVNRPGVWTFSNDISGEYGLTLRGVGALRLSGQNTYRGLTFIDGGHLILRGSVSGDVRNGGRLTSEGGRIGGVYFALPNSTTAVHVGSPLRVDGLAAVQGTMLILAPLDAAYNVQNRETLIRAGQVQGRFDRTQVGSGFFYQATLDYAPTEVAAHLTRTASAQAEVRAAGGNRREIEGAGWIERALDQLPSLREEAQSRIWSLVMDADHGLKRLGAVSAHVQASSRALTAHEAAERSRLAADRMRQSHGLSVYAEAHRSFAGDVHHDGYGVNLVWSEPSYGVLLGAGKLDGTDTFGRYDGKRLSLGARATHGRFEGSLLLDRIENETTRFVDDERLRSKRRDWVTTMRVEYDQDPLYVAAGALAYRMGAFKESGQLGVIGRADTHTALFLEGGVRESFGHEGDAYGRLDLDASLRRYFRRNFPIEGYFAGSVPVSAEGEPLPKERARLSLTWRKTVARDVELFAGAHGASDGRHVLDRRFDLGVTLKW